MTRVVGGGVVVVLMVALLAREASSVGAVRVEHRFRRALDAVIVLLVALFAGVVVIHLAGLSS